jgi:hypothetical protein
MRLPDRQRSRVVLIGTSRYEDEKLPDLPAVGRSIGDLAAALTDPVSGLVPENHCTVLADEGDIRLIGQRLKLAARQAEELLLVYYAGHGLVGGRRHDLYLALPGSEWAEPGFNSLEYDKLRSAVLDSPATTKVIVLDCCFSGRAVTDSMAGPVSEVIGQIEVNGTYVLASAPPDKVALILPGEDHTAFTGRLLRLLRDGVPGGPEFLTIDDLYRQLLTKMTAEGLHTPQKRAIGTADLLALARNQACAATEQGQNGDWESATALLRNRAYGPLLHQAGTPQEAASPSRRKVLIAISAFVTVAGAGIAVPLWMRDRGGASTDHGTAPGSATSGNNRAGKQFSDPLDNHHGAVWAVAAGILNGKAIAISGRQDGTLQVQDLATGVPIGGKLTGHTKPVYGVAIGSVNDKTIALSGSVDGTIRLWDLTVTPPAGRILGDRQPTAAITGVAIGTLGSKTIAVSAGDDGTVRLWDLTLTRPAGQILGGRPGSAVKAVAVGTLGGTPIAVTGGDDPGGRIWDLTTGNLDSLLTGPPSGIEGITAYPLDGMTTVLAGTWDGTAWKWNPGSA